MLIPIIIEDNWDKKKYGSIEKYENLKKKMIDKKIEECELIRMQTINE